MNTHVFHAGQHAEYPRWPTSVFLPDGAYALFGGLWYRVSKPDGIGKVRPITTLDEVPAEIRALCLLLGIPP